MFIYLYKVVPHLKSSKEPQIHVEFSVLGFEINNFSAVPSTQLRCDIDTIWHSFEYILDVHIYNIACM